MSKKKPDYFLLTIVAFLIGLGVLILASASAPYSQARFGNSYYFLQRQIIFGLIPGLILGFLAFKMNISLIKKWAPVLFFLNLIFLLMVFIPGMGIRIEGATRWVNLGIISFQPSEFLKITFTLYLAAWLASRVKKSQDKKSKSKRKPLLFDQTFIFFTILCGIVALALNFQPDLSTLIVIASIAILMYFSINTPLIHSILIILTGSILFFFLVRLFPYRIERFRVFLDPGADPMGVGYQLKQAMIAIGSGGISGTGLGMSMQKFFPGFLPHPISDSIFVVFSEETGFIGGAFLIFLFLIFLWRGFKISKEAKDTFSQLAAIGITFWITFQAFVNIGAMIKILPLTGIPLPFISYGGSALVTALISIGILLNISKQS